jgi:hypothetical protein
VGRLDPQFIALMNEVQELLRTVFQTQNALTIPISGTGSASMEASLCNFVEAGDAVLIGVNGYFGERLCDMAGRYGAEVRRVEREWGEVFAPEDFEAALAQKPAKLVALVHAETSTGALQPMEGIAEQGNRIWRPHKRMLSLPLPRSEHAHVRTCFAEPVSHRSAEGFDRAQPRASRRSLGVLNSSCPESNTIALCRRGVGGVQGPRLAHRADGILVPA